MIDFVDFPTRRVIESSLHKPAIFVGVAAAKRVAGIDYFLSGVKIGCGEGSPYFRCGELVGRLAELCYCARPSKTGIEKRTLLEYS